MFTKQSEGHSAGGPWVPVIDDLLLDPVATGAVHIWLHADRARLAMSALDHLERLAFLTVRATAVVALKNKKWKKR